MLRPLAERRSDDVAVGGGLSAHVDCVDVLALEELPGVGVGLGLELVGLLSSRLAVDVGDGHDLRPISGEDVAPIGFQQSHISTVYSSIGVRQPENSFVHDRDYESTRAGLQS